MKPSTAKTKRTAFLGPSGTHTESALLTFCPEAEGVPFGSIAEIFLALSAKKIDAAIVPIENVIQGPVTETLDQLVLYSGRITISNSFLMEIRHAVGVLPEQSCGHTWPRKISKVASHEQALRQCQNTLQSLFPSVIPLPSSSTAASMSQIATEKDPDTAVVGSASALREHGFQIVAEDASDLPGNKTRFALLELGNTEKLFASEIRDTPVTEDGHITSLVVNPGRDRQGLLFDILQVISVEHRVNLSTIHSRPDTKGGVLFHLDLAGSLTDPVVRNCVEALRKFALDSTGKTVEILILGSYQATPFYQLPFRSIGIIGCDGAMGRWFTDFFRHLGFNVVGCDISSELTIDDVCQSSDVVLLSVPMSKATAIAETVLPRLRPGQLVVENCSIKACILPILSAKAPQGVEVLGIHTMFGGKAPSLFGENVIITRTARSHNLAEAFESLLYKHGAKLHLADSNEHEAICRLQPYLFKEYSYTCATAGKSSSAGAP